MIYDNSVAPIVKWVGGKRQLMPEIKKYIPEPNDISTYYEPFMGGGAVLFDLQPKKAVVNDINSELINLYKVVKEDVESLIEELGSYKNEESFYYKIRKLDRKLEIYEKLTDVQRAARIHYLNKTCYNGLYRVNQAGEFNTPFGKYKNPNIQNADTLRAVSKYFNKADIRFLSTDFEEAIKHCRREGFVYFDPPYDPVSDSANFTGYAKGGFDRKEQIRLKKLCDKLDDRGVRFLLSNAYTDFIIDLYSDRDRDYRIETIQAKRSINSNGDDRGEVDEVLVRNYG